MATQIPNALNGTAPERTPVINITSVTITGLGYSVEDLFVVGGPNARDPVAGASTVTLSSLPVLGAPFYVFRGGLRQAINLDFSVAYQTGIVSFLDVVFSAEETILIDYFR